MLYWYSQKHVHEVFIFITIRRREATLMIAIAGSPGRCNDCSTPKGERKTQKPDAYVLPSSPGNYGGMYFLLLALDAKGLKFTYVKFEKN